MVVVVYNYMKPEQTKEEQINMAIKDIHNAFLADIRAKEKIIEINREKTATHYTLLKAKERLTNLELSLN